MIPSNGNTLWYRIGTTAPAPISSALSIGVSMIQDADERLAEAIAKRDKGLGELGQGDATGAVFVEAFEEVAPSGEEAPQILEFGVGYGVLGGGGGEEAHHGGDGMGIERGVVGVDEGGGEL